jgi:hypothetical protein
MATITTRSGKGTPLTNNEVDSNFTNLNTDKVEKSGDSMTGNLSFGDNDKAIFGAGSDLQIYHDGSKNWITSETSDIEVRVNGGGNFKVADEFGNLLIQANDNSDVILHHNASAKLATTSTGIDVTGTVTADGLTVGDSSTSNVIGSVVSANNTSAGLDFLGDLSGTKGVRVKYEGNGNLFSVSENNSGTLTERLRISDDGDISFYEDTGTTAKFFWDASAESLGIGTSSPATKLHTAGAYGNASSLWLGATNSPGSGGVFNGVYFGNGGANGVDRKVSIEAYQDSAWADAVGLKFSTLPSDASGLQERMRIDSSGNLLVGRTSNYGGAYLQLGTSTSTNTKPRLYVIGYRNSSFYGEGIKFLAGSDVNAIACNFHNSSGTNVGSIQTGSSSTTYATSSDYRLKEDWQPMSGSIDRVKALNPVNFAWKVDGSRVDGFLAHEAQEVVPEAVSGTKDAVTAYGNITDAEGTVVQEDVVEPETLEEGQVWIKVEDKPDYQAIDQSKLVPLLTSALQEAIAKIEDLETRIAALEN